MGLDPGILSSLRRECRFATDFLLETGKDSVGISRLKELNVA